MTRLSPPPPPPTTTQPWGRFLFECESWIATSCTCQQGCDFSWGGGTSCTFTIQQITVSKEKVACPTWSAFGILRRVLNLHVSNWLSPRAWAIGFMKMVLKLNSALIAPPQKKLEFNPVCDACGRVGSALGECLSLSLRLLVSISRSLLSKLVWSLSFSLRKFLVCCSWISSSQKVYSISCRTLPRQSLFFFLWLHGFCSLFNHLCEP